MFKTIVDHWQVITVVLVIGLLLVIGLAVDFYFRFKKPKDDPSDRIYD